MTDYKVDGYGTKRWLNNKSELHREDGPALEFTDGTKMWWVNGKRHRTDGPAIEWGDGDKEWFIDGLHHREDGPAREYAINKYWYYHGKYIKCNSQEEFLKLIKLKAFW